MSLAETGDIDAVLVLIECGLHRLIERFCGDLDRQSDHIVL